jgi:hypothetical protein
MPEFDAPIDERFQFDQTQTPRPRKIWVAVESPSNSGSDIDDNFVPPSKRRKLRDFPPGEPMLPSI